MEKGEKTVPTQAEKPKKAIDWRGGAAIGALVGIAAAGGYFAGKTHANLDLLGQQTSERDDVRRQRERDREEVATARAETAKALDLAKDSKSLAEDSLEEEKS